MTDTDRQYVRRRPGLSWHVVRTHTRLEDGWRTFCGRSIVMDDSAALDTLPGAKSCETCLRIFTRGVDPAPGWEDGVFVGQRVAVTGGIQVVEDDPSTSPVDPVTGMP